MKFNHVQKSLSLLFLISALPLTGCHQTPSAQKVDYNVSQVEKIEKSIAEYDWSDFEP